MHALPSTFYEPRWVAPQYVEGFCPGELVTIAPGTVLAMSYIIGRDSVVVLTGTHWHLNRPSSGLIVARPGLGNPWFGAHKGLVLLLVSAVGMLCWTWASYVEVA